MINLTHQQFIESLGITVNEPFSVTGFNVTFIVNELYELWNMHEGKPVNRHNLSTLLGCEIVEVPPIRVYKLFRIKNGKLFPLFINRSKEVVIGEWMQAECIPTKGFAVRQGWHCTKYPIAPHLKTELSSGEKRVWAVCEAQDVEYYKRPESQGGTWVLAQRLKVLEVIQ